MDVNVTAADVDRHDLINAAKSVYSLVIVLVLWEAVAQLGWVYPYFLPPLSEVLMTFVELTWPGAPDSFSLTALLSSPMFYNAYLTLKRAFLGLAIAIALGVPVGVLVARNAFVRWFFDPIITIGYPVPVIALVPVFLLWFGNGDMAKIVLVSVGTFWPIAINARNATRSIQQSLLWSARMMGTSDRKLVWKVVMPAAAPGILTGIQIAMPLSLIITFVFEMVAGGGGLGALEIEGVRSFKTPQVYAVLIAIMLIGMVLDRGLRYARGWLLRWA